MKHDPTLAAIEQRLRPGILSRDGFLGPDKRPLGEILEADDSAVRALGLDHARLAERLEALAAAGQAGLGLPVEVEGRFRASVREARGRIPCPWGDGILCPKQVIRLEDRATGETLEWTALQVHLIKAHGFYQGRGSRWRLEPARIKTLLYG